MRRIQFIIVLCIIFVTTITAQGSEIQPSGVVVNKMDERTVQNLEMLCRVWGFLKYYHPQVRDGKYDWDKELFSVMPKVINAKDSRELNKLLHEWVVGIGGTIEAGEMPRKTTLAWIDDTEKIGPKLSKTLNRIAAAKRTDNSFYSHPNDSIVDGHFPNDYDASYLYLGGDKLYPQADIEDDGYRLLLLFRFWNIIEYYSPYKDIMDREWGKVLTDFLPQIIETTDKVEFYKVVARLISSINDSHAYPIVNSQDIMKAFEIDKGYPIPFSMAVIDRQIVLTKVDTAVLNCGLANGDILLSIDGEDAFATLESFMPYIPSSNKAVTYDNLLGYMGVLRAWKNESTSDFKVLRDKDTLNMSAQSYKINWSKVDFSKSPNYRTTKSHCILENNIGYLNVPEIEYDKIGAVLDTLLNCDAIIIDSRGYTKGFNHYEHTAYFTPINTHSINTYNPSFINAGDFDKTEIKVLDHAKILPKIKGRYKGRVAVLVNERTVSASEFTSMSLQAAVENVVTIGSQTGGANGTLINMRLPYNITTGYSSIGIEYADGTQSQRTGLRIDHVVEPTVQGVKEGRDEVLEFAISYVTNN